MQAKLIFTLAVGCQLLSGCSGNSAASPETGASNGGNTVIEALDTNQYTFSAWRSSTSTSVLFSDDAGGMDFYRYRDSDCDVANILLCDSGAVDTLGAPPIAISDSAASTSESAYYQLGTDGGLMRTAIAADDHDFHSQVGLLGFDNRFWKFRNPSNAGDAAVIVSTDGQSWDSVTTTVPFGNTARAVVYDGAIWTVDVETDMKVHRSEDGATWIEMAATLPMDARMDSRLVATDDALFVVGGRIATNNDEVVMDIWRSSDGIAWSELSHDLPIPDRQYFVPTLGVHNNTLYSNISGEMNNTTFVQEPGVFYSSTDGINWSELDTGLSGNFDQMLSFRGYLWARFNDSSASMAMGLSATWKVSTDGTNWSDVNMVGSPPMSMVSSGQAVWNTDGPSLSLDGLNWISQPPATVVGNNEPAGFWAKDENIFFLQRQFVSMTESTYTAHRSGDGMRWETIETPFNGKAQVIDMAGTLYAHVLDESIPSSLIYSSTDGATWTELQDDVFSGEGRGFGAFGTVGGKLYLAGGIPKTTVGNSGYSTDDALSDIYESSDGVTWTEITTSGSEPAYIYHGFPLAVGSDLFFFDLTNQEGTVFQFTPATGVWVSYDGYNNPLEHTAPWSSNGFDTVAIFRKQDGTLVWLNNGSESRTSTDGINWVALNTGGETFAPFDNFDKVKMITDSKIYLNDGNALWRAPLTDLSLWDKYRTGVLVELAD